MSRSLGESDLGSVVGNLVKPQAAFTFRNNSEGMRCQRAQCGEISPATRPKLANSLLLCCLTDCFTVCVLGGIYESCYKLLLLRGFDHRLPCFVSTALSLSAAGHETKIATRGCMLV